MAASDGDLWDDSTDIEANTYYYYSDGKLHPFLILLWDKGGNDSYKYIRYKAGGKDLHRLSHTACSTVNSPAKWNDL